MPASNYQISFFIIITTAIVFLLAVLIITLLFLYQKKQLTYNNKLNELKLDFEKNLLSTQIEIQEQTFQTISREIHDNISLSLTLAKLNLNTLDWDQTPLARRSVESSIHILGNAITDLTHLSRSMNTDLIRNMGLLKALKEEVNRMEELAHLQVKYQVKGEPIFLDSEKELVIFRIIQEAFNNIIKHARASRINLELDYHSNYLDIHIRDNGVGLKKNENKESFSAGILNMKTRAGLFGGNLVLENIPKGGTEILVTIPYN